VRRLRIAIPAIILVIAAIIVAAMFFNPFRLITPFPIDPGKVSFLGTKVVMELPRVTGFTTDQRPYELTARAAVQDLTKLDVLELKDLRAKVELKDGQHVNITSVNGVYDTKAEVLKLNDHIVVTSTSGYEGYLSEATVHTATGNVVSESPVEIKLPNGFLNANRLEVRDNGAFIKFGGGVEMMVKPEHLRPADDAEVPPPAQEAAARVAAPAGGGPLHGSQRRPAVSP
jgi:lipopolysaccharide export system protein LptC